MTGANSRHRFCLKNDQVAALIPVFFGDFNGSQKDHPRLILSTALRIFGHRLPDRLPKFKIKLRESKFACTDQRPAAVDGHCFRMNDAFYCIHRYSLPHVEVNRNRSVPAYTVVGLADLPATSSVTLTPRCAADSNAVVSDSGGTK